MVKNKGGKKINLPGEPELLSSQPTFSPASWKRFAWQARISLCFIPAVPILKKQAFSEQP